MATSAMGTLGRRGQGDRPRRCRHNDIIRFCAASLTVVFELPLSDVTVVDGEKAVLECRVTVKPAAEVTWYVDTSFAVRSLRVAENGASQPLTLDHSFVQKTLYDKPPASRGPLEVSDVTRSSVSHSWLPRRRTAERRSWLTSSNGPSTCRRRGRASCGSGRRRLHGLHGRLPGRLPIPRLRRIRRDLSDRRPLDRFHGQRVDRQTADGDITDDVSSALLLQQFISHPHAVDIRTVRYCVLVDTRISTLHRDIVADQWEEDGRVKGTTATTFIVQRLREGTPYTTSPSTLSTAPVAVTIRIGPDKGSPSRSPTPSTSQRTERRRRGRRTVARLISDRSTRVGHTFSPLRHTCSEIFISFQQRTFNTSA